MERSGRPSVLRPPPKALKAYDQARQALDHWMDDPRGPHPHFPGVDLTERPRQVNGPLVIRSTLESIGEAPDWEEAHYLFSRAVDYGEILQNEGKILLDKEMLFRFPHRPSFFSFFLKG